VPRPNESRGRILEAAEAEFAEHGYFPAGMDAIAERAGVAKGTLYYNFASKGDLFVEVVSRGIGHLMSHLRSSADSDEPIRRRLSNIVVAQVEMLHHYPKIAAILLREMSAGLEDEVRARIAEMRDEYAAFVASLISDGMAEGVVRECDPRLAAETLIDCLYSASQYVGRTGGSPEEAQRFLTTLLSGGLIVAAKEEQQ
jgi:AcrR family transcriptional regulator